MNLRHVTSAVSEAQSNGRSESAVKMVKNLIKFYAPDDLHLEECIPIIELASRATVSSVTLLSPFEILRGIKVPLPTLINDVGDAPLQGDQRNYFKFISAKLAEIHEVVGDNTKLPRNNDELRFNQRNQTHPHTWTVGQQVLLQKKRITDPNRVITNPRHDGPYFVTEVVQGPNFGVSYGLTSISGQRLKTLVSGHRLRPYTATERRDFLAKYPPLQPGTDATLNAAQPPSPAISDSSATPLSVSSQRPLGDLLRQDYEPAVKIIKQRKLPRGRIEYYVLFEGGGEYWCDAVAPSLLGDYRLRQSILRRKRRKRQ